MQERDFLCRIEVYENCRFIDTIARKWTVKHTSERKIDHVPCSAAFLGERH